jgi:hypothetical protein
MTSITARVRDLGARLRGRGGKSPADNAESARRRAEAKARVNDYRRNTQIMTGPGGG